MSCFDLHRRPRVGASLLCIAAVTMATVAGIDSKVEAGVVSFGSGGNQFNMEFVTIGNAGNVADTTGMPNPAGSVGYEYGLGKFEVSRDMISKFNASQSLQISLDDMSSYGGARASQPATGVTWNEAARFVNWLNTSTGGFAAYKFTTSGANDNIELWTASDLLDYDASNPYRSKRASYVLPTTDEWYKAAFFNPNDGTYYDYANGQNTAPDAVASGTTANTAVYHQFAGQGPADVSQAGGLSPYGVMGLGGNVYEWEESSDDQLNSLGSSNRGYRGGNWNFHPDYMKSSARDSSNPVAEYGSVGFRVATVTASAPPVVPEPSMMVIGSILSIGGLIAKRRMRKQSA